MARHAAVRGPSGGWPGRSATGPSRPKILITNDDGIESRGILALKQALEPLGDMTVVAPDTNQSAVGHQKTLMRPLRVRERTLADGSTGWSVDGSPTDAVSLAFLGYFEHGFDLVASGINYGANLGDDITYSGTVSARRWRRSSTAARRSRSRRSTTSIPTSRWPLSRRRRSPGTSSSTACRAASSSTSTSPRSRPRSARGSRSPAWASGSTRTSSSGGVDPRGIPYYWIGGPPPSGLAVPGTDFHAVVHRRVAVTPIHLDLTGRSLLKRLRTWSWTLDEAAPTDGELAPDRPEGEAEEARIADEQAGDRR